MTRIEMPIQLKDMKYFERQNNIIVNVYGLGNAKINEDGEEVLGYATTLRVTKEIKPCHRS